MILSIKLKNYKSEQWLQIIRKQHAVTKYGCLFYQPTNPVTAMQDVYSLEEIKQGQEALQLLEKMSIQIQPINVKLNKQVMK